MRFNIVFSGILSIALFVNAQAQTRIEAKPEKWTASDSSVVTFKDNTIRLENKSKRKSAILWLNNTNFKTGTIELDIKGKDVAQQSFVGIVFHGVNDTTYKSIYFRPFNFRSTEKKFRAVQYADVPGNEWYTLREKFPGKYENAVNPVPDPNDWFHAKIVVDFPEVRVYVNDAKEPSLVVNQITDRKEGKLGLWADSDDGWFRNVTVKVGN
jgi:hypothetical protein